MTGHCISPGGVQTQPGHSTGKSSAGSRRGFIDSNRHLHLRFVDHHIGHTRRTDQDLTAFIFAAPGSVYV